MSEMIYVIGHSTGQIERFLKILKAHSVTMLVDIRTVPKSRHNPQFNSDTLRDSLAGVEVDYIHLKELGGLRDSSKNAVNTGWRNLSFRGFAGYMQTDEFEAGLDRLIQLGEERGCGDNVCGRKSVQMPSLTCRRCAPHKIPLRHLHRYFIVETETLSRCVDGGIFSKQLFDLLGVFIEKAFYCFFPFLATCQQTDVQA